MSNNEKVVIMNNLDHTEKTRDNRRSASKKLMADTSQKKFVFFYRQTPISQFDHLISALVNSPSHR